MSDVSDTSTGSLGSGLSLRWTRAGEPIGEAPGWSNLRPVPETNAGFTETGRYIFEKPHAEWTLHIDDEPLREDPARPSCWTWQPGFFAGEVTAQLHRADGSPAAMFLLDVAPDARKLGREMFARMVDELWQADPTLVIGSEPATNPIGELGALEDPWLAFVRLRRYAPEFLRALMPIRSRPRQALRVRRDSAPLHQVRRVDRLTAAALVRSPTVALFAPSVAHRLTSTSLADCRLDVPVTEETVDNAANRCLLALARALLRRTRQVRDVLQRAIDRESPSETETPLATRWPVRRRFLDQLAAQLTLLLRQPPFSRVSRPEITAAGLTSIATDPLYQRAWSRGWRALRHGLDRDDTTDRLWVSPSWQIYERWCFIRVSTLLTAALSDWSWQRVATPNRRRLIGSWKHLRCELSLQPTFPSPPREFENRWSISKQREPDLVLTIKRDDDTRFFVLEAKYRTTRDNVLDAMASVHIYQDSLRIGSRRPEASLLLIPSAGGAAWLEHSEFHATHRVGVHPLSPDAGDTLPVLLRNALAAWLRE
jgi:hypothetical protein